MIIWELSFLEDLTCYKFPIKEEEELFLKYEEDFFDNAISAKTSWKELLLMKEEQKVDVHISEIKDLNTIVVNQRAKDIFSVLEDKGEIEFLPFQSENNLPKLYLMNILGFVEDSLDKTETDIEQVKYGIVTHIDYIHFNSEIVEGRSIFKIRELPYSIFVSDIILEMCTANAIKGLSFDDEDIFWRND